LDDLFRFVSLDSHFWSSVFLIIRVDQLIGGGSTAQFQIGHVYRCDNMKNNTTTDKEDNTGHETGDHRRVDFSVKIERGYAADNSSQITDHSYNHADFLRGAALIQNWTWFDAAPVQSGGSNVSG
ncbi:hypothetical protein BOW49_02290, partial [Solemya velum gill symbiont]|uniref:hypothetical protein n=1 Tax=Solemya velum gill symbiont TaxID=2340 RepID=UPI0009D04EFD